MIESAWVHKKMQDEDVVRRLRALQLSLQSVIQSSEIDDIQSDIYECMDGCFHTITECMIKGETHYIPKAWLQEYSLLNEKLGDMIESINCLV